MAFLGAPSTGRVRILGARPLERVGMSDDTKIVKTTQQLATEVAEEDDPDRLAELADQLLLAMEEEKRQADARIQLRLKFSDE